MARQKGLIQIEGTIGGINFYVRKGVALARQGGGGFNGKAIKTKASMVRVRENGSEFGAASRVKKLLRMSVQDYLLHSKNATLHGRMMALLQAIKVCDLISERGARTVWVGLKTTVGTKLFTDFLFTPKQDVFSLLNGMPVLSDYGENCGFNSLSFGLDSFKKSATALVLTYFVVDYDAENLVFKRYVAQEFTLAKSDIPAAPFTFEINDLPPIYTFRMAFLAVQYYENCNGKLVALKEQGMTGLRCLGVWS